MVPPKDPREWLTRAVESTVHRVRHSHRPGVARIRYQLSEDMAGNPCIYFRVVLADSVAADDLERPRTARSVIHQIDGLLDPAAWGRAAYYNFRSESEQRTMPDRRDWEFQGG